MQFAICALQLPHIFFRFNTTTAQQKRSCTCKHKGTSIVNNWKLPEFAREKQSINACDGIISDNK
jgi:hypothetical protein